MSSLNKKKLSKLSKFAKLTRRGYTIEKKFIPPTLLEQIYDSLKVSPKTHPDYQKFADVFGVFSESSSKIYLPKFWALEHIGKPRYTKELEGSKINVKFSLNLYDYQVPIVDKIYNDIITKGSTILSIYCGGGKTAMALYLTAKLGFKTLIVVHTSILLKQWKERIKFFLPGAKVGIIRGAKFESKDNDICIGMLQTLTSNQRVFQKGIFDEFGFSIFDECHHLGAPQFSRVMPTVCTKYSLGLSATPKRDDALQKVFHYFLGELGWNQNKRVGTNSLIVKYINYLQFDYVEKRRWNNSVDLHAMVEIIINSQTRNKFIVENAIKFASMGRQVLVLSVRRNHLKLLQKMTEKMKTNKEIPKILEKLFPYKETIHQNIMSFYHKPLTTGLYLGQMKPHELEESAKSNIIFGTYQLVSEGTDIPTLNTLIMASPKKKVEQVVGRILRAKTNFDPLVIDICDNFSVYLNQGKFRQKYYKSQEYHIDQFKKTNDEYIELTNGKQTKATKPKKTKKKSRSKKSKSREKKESHCMIVYSDSD